MQLDLLLVAAASVGFALAGDLGSARADPRVGAVNVVKEEFAGLVARGLDAFEEEADAVFAELAAVLEEQRLVHALAGVVFLGLLALGIGLCVEGFDEQAVGFFLGEDGWVAADEF